MGDHSLVTFNIDEIKLKDKIQKTAFNSHSVKKPNVCASTMVFLCKNVVAMTLANPTQNKDSGILDNWLGIECNTNKPL